MTENDKPVSSAPAAATAPAAPPPLPAIEAPKPKVEFSKTKVGNLTYTKGGLVMLYFWLIIFDFIFVFAENHVAPVMQVHLAKLGMSNKMFSMVLVVLPSVMNFFVNPFVGVKSDRHRGPRGRRIPFLLYSTPFVCLFMALLGFGNEISEYLHQNVFPSSDYNTVAIWTFSVAFLVFAFFNLFPNIVVHYLYNDVVPRGHLVKFMSLLRIPSLAAGSIFGWFLFGFTNKTAPLTVDFLFIHYHSDAFWYPKFILIGLAIIFAVFFPIACMMIKEPKYPPPPPLGEGQKPLIRWKNTIKTLATECFSHKFYRMYFITMSMDMIYTVVSLHQTPMLDSMGVNFDSLGKITAMASVVQFFLLLATAGFGDRWRPMPVMVVGWIGMVATAPVGLLFLIPNLSPETYLWIRVVYHVVHMPVNLTLGLASGALGMTLLPRERYGQFAAANAMLRVILAQVVGAMIGALFMDLMQWLYWKMDWFPNDPNYYRRYCFVWQLFFQVVTFICFVQLWRMWKKLGGKDGYTPPAVGKPKPAAVTA